MAYGFYLHLFSQQERLVAPAFLSELKRPRHGFEFEAEVLAKPSNLAEKMQIGSHRANALLLNGWQDAAMDLSKQPELTVGGESGPIGHMSHTVQSAPHKISGIGSIQGSLGLDMAGILQAGLIHPVTGQIVNGSLRRDDAMFRRRRGRRRNVEPTDLNFLKSRVVNLAEQQVCGINRSLKCTVSYVHYIWRVSLFTSQSGTENISHPVVSSTSSQSECPSASPATIPAPPSATPSTAPPAEALNVTVEREAANKGLMEWLRQNPSYNMELPTFPSVGCILLVKLSNENVSYPISELLLGIFDSHVNTFGFPI